MGLGLRFLGKEIKEDEASLRLWSAGNPAGFSYCTFYIPKRSGGRRKIDAPNEVLKALQQKIYEILLKEEQIPTASTGFVVRRSIIDNAKPHVGSKAIINIDLKNFFHSITREKVQRYWQSCNWDDQCVEILTNICCHEDRLPQGAPTSPSLSNVVNRMLDGALFRLARRHNAKYTRYADDISFSFPKGSGKIRNRIRSLVRGAIDLLESDGYRIQYDKGIKVLRSHQKQIVTGLVVNERVRLPREKRRMLRAMRHRDNLGLLSELEKKKLEGYERFYTMVERPVTQNLLPTVSMSTVTTAIQNNPTGLSLENASAPSFSFTACYAISALFALISSVPFAYQQLVYGSCLAFFGVLFGIAGIIVHYRSENTQKLLSLDLDETPYAKLPPGPSR